MHQVPSPAALRILRQLAYIGSGTVAAVGVLVGEERRRRICTAQRILDNKKKLQSCERWVGNRNIGTAAAAPLAAHDSDDLVNGLPQEWQHHILQDRPRPEKGQGTVEVDASRADFLPSQVARNYERAHRRKGSTTPRHTWKVQTSQETPKTRHGDDRKRPKSVSKSIPGLKEKQSGRLSDTHTLRPQLQSQQDQTAQQTGWSPKAVDSIRGLSTETQPYQFPAFEPARHDSSTEHTAELHNISVDPASKHSARSSTSEIEIGGIGASGPTSNLPDTDRNREDFGRSGQVNVENDLLRKPDPGALESRQLGDWSPLYPIDALDNSLTRASSEFGECVSGSSHSVMAVQDASQKDDSGNPLRLSSLSVDESPSHEMLTPIEDQEPSKVSTSGPRAEKVPVVPASLTTTFGDLVSFEAIKEDNVQLLRKLSASKTPPGGDDAIDRLLQQTEDGTFGVERLSLLLNDRKAYNQAYHEIRRLPEAQTKLHINASFPSGIGQLATWQLRDLIMTKKIAYHLAYKVCSRLMKLHRYQEAISLFVQVFGGCMRGSINDANLPDLPMRLPARWKSRGLLLRIFAASLNRADWSSVQTLFNLAASSHSQGAALEVIQSRVRDLCAKSRHVEAAKILWLVPEMRYTDAALLERSMEITSEVLHSALAAGDLLVAFKTFEWTEGQGFPDKAGRLEPIIRACLEYSPDSNASAADAPPEKQGEVLSKTHPILFAVSMTRGLPQTAIALARYVVHSNAEWNNDKDLVLACNAVMRRVWRETSNFWLLHGLYEDMYLSTKTRGNLPVSIYNCWLTICYKAGHGDEAQRCLQDLQSAGGPGADISSFGEIMYGHAMAGNWPAVEAMLLRLHETGQMSMFSRRCYLTFGKIFQGFLREFGVQRGWCFITKVIEEYGVEPSVRLSNLFLDHCVQERQWSMPVTWFRWLNEHGFQLRINAMSVLQMMRRFQLHFRPERSQFVHMCHTLRQTRKGLVTHQLWRKTLEAVAYDARRRVWRLDSSKDSKDPIVWRWKSLIEHPMAKLEQNLKTLPSVWHVAPDEFGLPESEASKENDFLNLPDNLSRHRFSSSRLDQQMTSAVSLQKPAEAVQMFRQSLSAAGYKHSNISLSIAVDASLRANEGFPGPAHELLREAKDAGLDIIAAKKPILIHRLRMHRWYNSNSSMKEMVIRFYQSLANAGKHDQHHLCVSAAKHLIFCGKAEAGVELLSFIYKSHYAKQVPMDIVAMSVFVKGYAAIGHLQGIKWAVNKVLEDEMRIDTKFCQELSMARKPLRELSQSPGLSQDSQTKVHEALDQLKAWQAQCLKRRDEQEIRTKTDGRTLVKIIQELSTDFDGNDDFSKDSEGSGDNGKICGLRRPTKIARYFLYEPVRPEQKGSKRGGRTH
ncbi:hypothetical protein EV356DRAFT_577533 [Viridothelium virens]|uniref:Pentatricopeptide repeat protein n=1 Tax=Viridothelium virens TaxID=1048519 RepID=A0A6A6H6P0_VIRVR|nr:hypothetical protein EV356DRAFT_577533 [Viridothelium virens]